MVIKMILKNIDTALDYVKYCSAIKRLKEEFPLLQTEVIGKSVLGKNIYALKIGKGYDSVLFAAAFHGSEHITTNISLMLCEKICMSLLTDSPLCDINLKRALKGRGIIILPRVNPDGCDISILGAAGAAGADYLVRKLCEGDYRHYNANARGVDINHNFPAGWETLKAMEKSHGILGPAATRFGGFSPISEPETAALVSLCRSENIAHVLALHTQGEVIYWNYGDKTPKKSQKMAEIMAAVSGYSLDVPVKLATGGGFKDYFIEEFSRPGFTIELGIGQNPLNEKNVGKIYKKAEEMLILSAIM